jgi:hypothetical protein
MNRMTKIVLTSAAVGGLLPLGWGLLQGHVDREHRMPLDQALWVIDADGFTHSPTSHIARVMIAELSAAGVDVNEKKWDTEVFINLSHDPDIVRKTLSGQVQQRQ